MGLNFPGSDIKNLFPHSKRFEQGLSNIRVGLGEVIVAKDGSGDFEGLIEAIKATKSGTILIKEGTFEIGTGEKISPSDGTKIKGVGKETIIKINTLSNDGASRIDLLGKKNIAIEDLTIEFEGPTDTNMEALIDSDNADNIEIRNILFKPQTATTGGVGTERIIWTSLGNNTGNLIIEKCTEDESSGDMESMSGAAINKGIIKGNRFENIDLMSPTAVTIDNSIILGNFFNDITLTSGSDNNVVVGNKSSVTDNGTGNSVTGNVG